MRVSDAGINFITEHEGVELAPYRDQAGLWTVGVGHLLVPNDPYNRPITLDEAKSLLRLDVRIVETCINRALAVSVNQNQFDALSSFVFNVGCEAFRNSTLLRKLNQGDFGHLGRFVPGGKDIPPTGAAAEFLKWNKITLKGKKVVSNGLDKRRRAESELFLRG